MKLKDKATVVAEIERLISNGQTKLKESEERKDYENYVALAERIATCINILSFIDTLKVKEVDLEKEIAKYLFPISVQDIQYEPFTQMEQCARHFFKLGLKVQKGEVLIEKACNLLDRMIWEVTYEDLEGDSTQHYDKMEFIEDFRNYMKKNV